MFKRGRCEIDKQILRDRKIDEKKAREGEHVYAIKVYQSGIEKV